VIAPTRALRFGGGAALARLGSGACGLDGSPAVGDSGIREELRVDERRDGEEEMADNKKLGGSLDVVVGTVTGSMMVAMWLNVSSAPTQGGGGSVQCGRREKKVGALLTSSGGWKLCSKAAMINNGRQHSSMPPMWR
jgi:hypothetical protein